MADEPRLTPPPAAHVGFVDEQPVAQSLAGPGGLPGLGAQRGMPTPAPQTAATPTAGAPAQKANPATEMLARRTGALVNEVNFPGFVSQLVHGTFDAIVDAAIRQMESYADLLAAVAKTTEQFTSENVSLDQARDWLAQRYPGEVALRLPRGSDEVAAGAHLAPRAEGASPAWLSEFGLEGRELNTELMEEQLLPQVRNRIGAERHRLLATMVMLGLNRVAVRDGSISAKVMFRAEARDAATVQYAQNPDSGTAAQAGQWGARGSNTYSGVSTFVQSLNVNTQNDTSLRADMFGEVKLNFVSETLSLDKLADPQALGLIQRQAVLGARPAAAANPASAAIAAPAAAPIGGPR